MKAYKVLRKHTDEYENIPDEILGVYASKEAAQALRDILYSDEQYRFDAIVIEEVTLVKGYLTDNSVIFFDMKDALDVSYASPEYVREYMKAKNQQHAIDINKLSKEELEIFNEFCER